MTDPVKPPDLAGMDEDLAPADAETAYLAETASNLENIAASERTEQHVVKAALLDNAAELVRRAINL